MFQHCRRRFLTPKSNAERAAAKKGLDGEAGSLRLTPKRISEMVRGAFLDHANYFRHIDITPEEASSRGLLARDKGRKGFAVGRYASDDLYALYRAGKISESKAAVIADEAVRERRNAIKGVCDLRALPRG